MSDTDKSFPDRSPKLYDTYLVPLIFEPYARRPGEALERAVACPLA